MIQPALLTNGRLLLVFYSQLLEQSRTQSTCFAAISIGSPSVSVFCLKVKTKADKDNTIRFDAQELWINAKAPQYSFHASESRATVKWVW